MLKNQVQANPEGYNPFQIFIINNNVIALSFNYLDNKLFYMKFLFSFLLLFVTYLSSANTIETVQDKKASSEVTFAVEVSDRGKKAKRAQRKRTRHGQKMNKKRKKACNNWGKRSYAG